MVPYMLFKYKFQRMFSRESLKSCHFNNVDDITDGDMCYVSMVVGGFPFSFDIAVNCLLR